LQDSNELIAIDLATQEIVWRMVVGKMPAGVWMTPGDKYLMVGLTGSDSVKVIDWRQQKIVKDIKTGRGAHNFRPLGDKRHIFLTNRVDSSISIIDMDKMEKVADITGLPSGPDCMDVTADGKELWVTFRFAKKVGIIDIASRKLVSTIPVGKSPHGIFFHPSAAWE
jgi:YVTN family beta-propeller protein